MLPRVIAEGDFASISVERSMGCCGHQGRRSLGVPENVPEDKKATANIVFNGERLKPSP